MLRVTGGEAAVTCKSTLTLLLFHLCLLRMRADIFDVQPLHTSGNQQPIIGGDEN